ncbi:MAG: T9SS type A sorting domain-containing protein, partial [Cyclobacteriaceae bacterium]
VNDVNKTWDITTSSGDSNLSLFWNSSTEGDEFVNESAQINHYDAVTDMRWEFVGSAGSTEHITDMIYSVQALNVMDFSPFSISSHGAPLPVELLSFEATPRENSVRVQWKTESELNNDHFVLEKSIDGESFEVMEVVAGSGNSSQQIEYKIFDQNPVEGYQYYQLTQVDFDGTRENLGIRRVEFRGSGALDFYMFPNPTSNVARISNLSAGHYEAEILSIDGRIISTREVTIDSHNQIVEFRVENLPTGVYMLNLQSGSSVYSKKLVKR